MLATLMSGTKGGILGWKSCVWIASTLKRVDIASLVAHAIIVINLNMRVKP